MDPDAVGNRVDISEKFVVEKEADCALIIQEDPPPVGSDASLPQWGALRKCVPQLLGLKGR